MKGLKLKEFFPLGNKKSMGLTEIVVAAVILASITTGLTATFVAVRKYISRSQKRLEAAFIAQHYMSLWNNQVDQSTWDTGSLRDGLSGVPFPPSVGGKGTYSVSDVDIGGSGDEEYRKVVVKVTF